MNLPNLLLVLSPLLVGWMLDRLLGDPTSWVHPIVGFGRWIGWAERRTNHPPHQLLAGAILLVVSVAGVYLLLHTVLTLLGSLSPALEAIVGAICIFYALSGTTLIREVVAVFDALDRDLEQGRSQLARIVGRNTSELDAQHIRTAALETLAENLNDGVIAPLFWYAIGGVPAMMAYKMVNTLDSMVGYKNERYLLYGRWSARADDLLGWIPARLTALLLWVVSGARLSHLRFILRYGTAHASPNSGFPEAALAGVLHCRFGGTHKYGTEWVEKPYIGEHDKELTRADLHTSKRLTLQAECLFVAIIMTTLALTHL